MTDRYFVASPIKTRTATLTGAEAHHIIHVMRAKQGDQLILFDGGGAEFQAKIEAIGRREVELAVLSRHEVNRELPLELILGVPLPKGDRQRWLVEKAVELGVGKIVPLSTCRSVVLPRQQTLDRLGRTVIEASKQCGRNLLTEISQPESWADFVAATKTARFRLLAHPGEGTSKAKPAGLATALTDLKAGDDVVLAIGPEGGFTPNELSLASQAGWQAIDLGPRILRVETAAIMMAALVAAACGDCYGAVSRPPHRSND